jgi:hypothetical protein
MKKILVITALALLATGCGRFDRWMASITGGATKECVDGVQYLQFTSGASVAYNKDGSIKRCLNLI